MRGSTADGHDHRASEQAPRRIGGFDLSKPVLYGFAAVLCLLIVLPMSWLVYYSFTDKDGALTLQNFVTLIARSDAARSADHHLHARDLAPA